MKPIDKMTEQLRFQKSVLLIDAEYLAEDLATIKRQLEERMGKPDVQGDLVQLFTLLGLDAGLDGDPDGALQVILLQRAGKPLSLPLEPGTLDGLDGMATRTQIGEMSFMVLALDEQFSMEDLYHDVLGLALEASEVTRLIMLPLPGSKGGSKALTEVYEGLLKDLEIAGKPEKTVLFDLFQMGNAPFEQLPLASPLAYVLGYRAG